MSLTHFILGLSQSPFQAETICVRWSVTVLLLVFIVFCAEGQAALLRVPSVYANIQDAINIAAEGDTVLVADGTYTGDGFRNLRFLRKNVVLASERGPAYTTLDFGSDSVETHQGIILGTLQTRASVIDGFTFRRGRTDPLGNTAGALGCHGASPTVKNCIFAGNAGWVIVLENSSATFENCTFVANQGSDRGTIDCFSSAPEFHNCLLAFNTGGSAIFFLGETSSPIFTFSLIYGNQGGDWIDAIANQMDQAGNLHTDPKLCDYITSDYHLRADSPCRPDSAGSGLIGALGIGCTDGTSPYAINVRVTPLDANGHLAIPTPTFSWEADDTIFAAHWGYLLQVVADLDTTGRPLWADTGTASFTTSAVYTGPPLNSHATYYVRVKLSDEYGTGPWRTAPFFTHLASMFYVPVSQPTIQDAINVAFNRDTIIVKSGTYTGKMNRNITFHGKPIVLKSESGPAHTVVDGENTANTPVFNFREGEDTSSVLEGFTITRGSYDPLHDFPGPGGMSCGQSSPIVRNCVFVKNSGAGCASWNAHPILENCTFTDNNAYYGSALYSEESQVTLRRCNLVYNGNGAVVFVDNYSTGSPVSVECSNIFGNKVGGWDFPYVVEGGNPSDTLSFDPHFCSNQANYLALDESSLCLPANSACGKLIGAIDSICGEPTDVASDVRAIEVAEISFHCYPNPFNATTRIQFVLPQRTAWSITIFTLLGQQIETIKGVSGPGVASATWSPGSAASGVYFAALHADSVSRVTKILLLK